MTEQNVEYAGFWIRTGACLIDTFILYVALLPLLWVFYQGDWDLMMGTGLSDGDAVLWFDLLVNYALPFIYTVAVWLIWSASPGKILLGIKIVDASTGQKINLLQACIRYIGYFPSALVLLLGLIWVAFDSRKQGWHDKMANTVVIKYND